MIEVRPLGEDTLEDLATLFEADRVTRDCWCMWFITSVSAFHAAGEAGNRDAFVQLMAEDPHPLGLVAHAEGRPVGWCAVGPRSRFARAVKTPTFRNHAKATSDEDEWLVPCFYVAPDARGRGVAAALLQAGIDAAKAAGAEAIAGFPLAGERRRSSGDDFEVGVESLFAGCGFDIVDRPSSNRVVMRRGLR
jgi:GNAT superfamily N-acetyltransferase